MVEKESFRGLLKYQCPGMKDSDIPHRTILREEVMHKARIVMHRLRERFKVPNLNINMPATYHD